MYIYNNLQRHHRIGSEILNENIQVFKKCILYILE